MVFHFSTARLEKPAAQSTKLEMLYPLIYLPWLITISRNFIAKRVGKIEAAIMTRIVYYKLQTTDRTPVTGRHVVQIVSIGAMSRIPGTDAFVKFHQLIIPNRKGISQGATEKHGLDHLTLIRRNAVSTTEGIRKFVAFLDRLQRHVGEKLILVSLSKVSTLQNHVQHARLSSPL